MKDHPTTFRVSDELEIAARFARRVHAQHASRDGGLLLEVQPTLHIISTGPGYSRILAYWAPTPPPGKARHQARIAPYPELEPGRGAELFRRHRRLVLLALVVAQAEIAIATPYTPHVLPSLAELFGPDFAHAEWWHLPHAPAP